MSPALFSSLTLMPQPVTSLLSLAGAELAGSRRYVDLDDAEACRWQYESSTGISVRVDYSLDYGVTFQTLAAEYETLGATLRVTAWQTMPADAKRGDVLLRCFAIGAGLLTTVSFVEFQFR